MERLMKMQISWLTALVLIIGPPAAFAAKHKGQRGMLESMQSMPCGVKEHGLTGLGAIYGSVGVHHVNADEKLCPQYLFRTDEMDYHIRPMDKKHPVILPVGHEAEFKIKKDHLFLKLVDGDKKTRAYQVVSMEPVNSEEEGGVTNSSYQPGHRPAGYRTTETLPNRQAANQGTVPNQTTTPPPQH